MQNQEIDILELFSGIGGFTKGFQQAGFTINNHYYSEIDNHAIANYKYNFKNSTYVGSVTNVRGIIKTINENRSGKLIITFGSPCQDFSLAGKGLGLDGNKSSLIKYAIFLVKWLRPDVFIWENVKGAFSTNDGADYWAIIQAFTNLDGYRCEQQLLNTSWFLPQNRERIYLVGHLTGRSEPGVFPIRAKTELLNESGSDAEKQIASCLQSGENSHIANGEYKGMNLIEVKSGTLRTHKDGKGFRESSGDDCPTLPARAREDGSGQVVIKVVGNLKGDGGHNVNNIHSTDGLAPTVRENHGKITAIEVKQINQSKESGGNQPYQGNRVYDTSGLMPALHLDSRNNIQVKTNTKKGFETATEGDSINLSNPNSETRRGRVGVAQTLDTQCNQAVVKAVLTPNRSEKRQNGRRMKEDKEDSFTLGCQDQHGVMINNSIRRLTEIECERLQGFPDDWTKYGIYERQIWTNKKEKTFEIVEDLKEIPKTQRYKMCGNAVTVDVVEAIASNLKLIN